MVKYIKILVVIVQVFKQKVKCCYFFLFNTILYVPKVCLVLQTATSYLLDLNQKI